MRSWSVMRPLILAVCVFALLRVAASGVDTFVPAFQARALLGPEVWSRVLRIRNDRAGPHSRYPAEFHGLVFAFEDVLWLYTGIDGTQSLSLYRDRLAADEADLAPLLRAIEPGLSSFADVTGQPPAAPVARRGPLPNDCFVACVVRWRSLQHEADAPTRARFLAFYAERLRGGHTVLEFWRAGRRYLFDPDARAGLRELSTRSPDEPIEVGRSIFPHEVAAHLKKARAFDLRANADHLEIVQAREHPADAGREGAVF